MFYIMAILGTSDNARSLLGVPNERSVLLTAPGSDQNTTDIFPGTPGVEFFRDREHKKGTSRELRQLSPEGMVSAFNIVMSDTRLSGNRGGEFRRRMKPDKDGNFSIHILSCEGDVYHPLKEDLGLVGAAIEKHRHAADLLDAELPEGWSVFGTWAGERDLSQSDAADLRLDEFYWYHGLPDSMRTAEAGSGTTPVYVPLQLDLF